MSVVVMQISRGMAPAESIARAVREALQRAVDYQLIWGHPAAEAKTMACEYALERSQDLVLVEDDVLATSDVWDAAILGSAPVGYCDATCRDGRTNTGRRADGRFIATGTVLVRLSLPVLVRLRDEVRAFPLRGYEFHKDVATGGLIPTAPDPLGRGSDMWLWHHVMKLDYEPVCFGRVTSILHPYNDGAAHDLRAPQTFRYV